MEGPEYKAENRLSVNGDPQGPTGRKVGDWNCSFGKHSRERRGTTEVRRPGEIVLGTGNKAQGQLMTCQPLRFLGKHKLAKLPNTKARIPY